MNTGVCKTSASVKVQSAVEFLFTVYCRAKLARSIIQVTLYIVIKYCAVLVDKLKFLPSCYKIYFVCMIHD